MEWNIITDSSCDMMPEPNAQIPLASVPFVITIGHQEYIDDEHLDVAAMVDAMEKNSTASHSACPGPQTWADEFEKASHSIAITISSNLSGSMSSAVTAKEMVLEEHPEKKIAVLDSKSTGPEMTLCVEKIRELIGKGMHFEDIVSEAEAFLKKTRTAFALCSFDNLVKNGRMNRIVGFIARHLGVWGIGYASDHGTIAIKGKTRGAAGAINMILEDMKEHGFTGGKVSISHCQNPAIAEKLKEKIKELWTNCEVHILPTRGLCSYYAERGGFIISY